MENTLQFTAHAVHHTNNYGDFVIQIVKNTETKEEHVALIKGTVTGQERVLVRISSECLPGTALDSADCECKDQIDLSLEKIAEKGQGVLILLRQEGRGHGLGKKIEALANKNKGFDTFEAVEMLGLQADIRSYWEAAEILRQLEIKSIELLTNNPDKVSGLTESNVSVVAVTPLEVPPTEITMKHLLAKKARGHHLSLV